MPALQTTKAPDAIQPDVNAKHWISGFPGLLWHIHIPQSRLVLFNRWEQGLLGPDTQLLLKDAHFRNLVVCKEDLPALAEFWDLMANREPAEVSFRLLQQPSYTLLLQGWPHPDPEWYSGLLQEALNRVNAVNGKDYSNQILLRARYPVLVVDREKKLIVAYNNAADSLFDFSALPKSCYPVEEYVPEWSFRVAGRLGSGHDVWGGSLSFTNREGVSFSAAVRLSSCKGGTRSRIAFLEFPQQKGRKNSSPLSPYPPKGGVPATRGLRETLSLLCASPSPCPIEGIIFSDINAAKGYIQEYGVGAPFAKLPWGAKYAYEGTIAQHIERFSLSSLIVDDTMDSIKSIDWALFIPHGIRSYFARAFYREGVMHAVMILASTKPGTFSVERLEEIYAPYGKAFEDAVEQWRREKN
ncbi:MAG: hypothetical protein ACLU6O_11320 [Bilophila wadsworthia]